jgi:hypothetical protein
MMRTGAQSMRYVEEHMARTAARPLTERQAMVLAYIRERPDFPGEVDIQRRFGWTYHQAAEDVLLALACRGLIERIGWRKIGRRLRPQWQLTDKGKAE